MNPEQQAIDAYAGKGRFMLNMDEIDMLFAALPDEHQVRFLARLSDRMTLDTDAMHDALRGMAEDVSNFSATDDYRDLLRADDIHPTAMHSALARELYRKDRDGRLDHAIAYLQRRAA